MMATTTPAASGEEIARRYTASPLPAENTRRQLFGDASHDRIVEILTTDWDRFSAVAYLFAGFPQKWVDAVAELAVLYEAFIEERRDLEKPHQVFDLLNDRAWTFGVVGGGTFQARTWMWQRLGMHEIMGCDYPTFAARRAKEAADEAKRVRREKRDAALIAKHGPDALARFGWSFRV